MNHAASNGDALLMIDDLRKSFGGVDAVAGVGFVVRPREIVSLIGPNGAGKTTIFNLVCRLYTPSGGTLQFDGRNLAKARPHDLPGLGIGRTFQNLALFRHGTVVQNLLTGLHTHLRANPMTAAFWLGPARAEELAAREEVERIIEFLEIEELRDTPVGLLSYGQQKRVELGRALATRPKLLLLDEMVSGMNQEETEDIARFVLDIRDELGTAVVMIEHDMNIVMDISDRVVVLNFGRKIAEGTPAEILANDAVRAAYLGGTRAGDTDATPSSGGVPQ